MKWNFPLWDLVLFINSNALRWWYGTYWKLPNKTLHWEWHKRTRGRVNLHHVLQTQKKYWRQKNKGMASFLYNHHGPMVAAQSIVKLCTATYKVFLVALKLFTSFFTHGHQTKCTTKSGIWGYTSPQYMQRDTLAQSFSCVVVGSLPFTCLGLPFSLTKLKVIDCLPLVKRCEKGSLAPQPFFLKLADWKSQMPFSLHSRTSWAPSSFKNCD